MRSEPSALDGLTRHDLLVQLFRGMEPHLITDGVLDAEAAASMIEGVLDSAGYR